MKNRYFVYLGIAGVAVIVMLNWIVNGNTVVLAELIGYGIAPICGIIFVDFWVVTKPQEGVTLKSLIKWDVALAWIGGTILACGIGCVLSGFIFGAFLYWVIARFMDRVKYRRQH